MANIHANIITKELGSYLRKNVAACLRLLDDGASVPFIARYRKEATGGMDEVVVRSIQERHTALTEIDKRKEHILTVIREADALTPELEERINETFDPIVLEDLYLPYKPKRNTRASNAKTLGLEPLAKIIMAQNTVDLSRTAKKFLSKEVVTIEDAISGASDIIAEWVNESEKARNFLRSRYQRSAVISSKAVPGKEDEGRNFQNYFKFSEPLRTCSSYRYLAIRRGEEEGVLKVTITIDDEDKIIDRLSRMFIKPEASAEIEAVIKGAVKDSYRRLMRPSIETEIANITKEKSDTGAIQMFSDNVRQLLMTPPLGKKRVLAIDPGFRTGCKIVALDERGDLMAHDVIYPTPPANDYVGASDAICYFVDQFRIDAIAIGNGTAGRETERFIRDLMLPRKVQIFMVNEDGASIYSASEVAREEFPNEDVTVRGAISIGRRLLDPLAELVKIEPKSIGVGQYQHDVNQVRLKESLDYVVESCVNSVGVNVNTASKQLLSYVSGIGPTLASNIVKYRSENGNFKHRESLMNVPRMGEKAFQQSAGFLRIPGGENPLDNTAVHPERYALVEQIAQDLGVDVEHLVRDKSLINKIDLERYVTKEVGLPTLTDIVLELEKPGRDPRSIAEETPFDESVRKIEDLHIGQILMGKVNNITAFGLFVDLGMKENGLVHISQLSDRYLTSPHEVASIGQVIKVRVIDVDINRGRISLSMKDIQ